MARGFGEYRLASSFQVVDAKLKLGKWIEVLKAAL
jgi:hypothetical protein